MTAPQFPDGFSPACPACGASGPVVRTQRNDFAGRPARRVSTTRGLRCRGCGHAWAETVPNPGGPPVDLPH